MACGKPVSSAPSRYTALSGCTNWFDPHRQHHALAKLPAFEMFTDWPAERAKGKAPERTSASGTPPISIAIQGAPRGEFCANDLQHRKERQCFREERKGFRNKKARLSLRSYPKSLCSKHGSRVQVSYVSVANFLNRGPTRNINEAPSCQADRQRVPRLASVFCPTTPIPK